ncbi:MAG TPA: NAD(P)H-hydrate dehydratase [Pyrinomonadaceae bacterium]|nr:NAD(P)H-hydrate dehydratase [Pyrinomonadaceae bacterium]
MQKILSAEEMREVDRQTTEKYGIPSIILMENAAHAAANVIKEKLGGSVAGKSFLIICGKGNNGGDGAALARILWTQGAITHVYLFGKIEETKGDARINFDIIKKITDSALPNNIGFSLRFDEDSKADYLHHTGIVEDFVIDALFGTGLTRKLEGEIKELTAHLSKWKEALVCSKIISIDVPSGLNADLSEQIGENIQADLTITFTSPKLANVFPPASNFNGELVVANIGSPQELIDNSPSKTFLAEKEDAQIWLEKTRVEKDSYKKTRGACLIVAGSDDFSGAAILAANACFAAGAGMVSVAVPQNIKSIVAAKTSDEIIVKTLENTNVADEKVDIIALGCGMQIGRNPHVSKGEKHSITPLLTCGFLQEIIENRHAPMVLDAEALNALAEFDLQGSDEFPLILTPHIGEFKKLLGREIGENKIEEVRNFAEKHNVILVLKGERSLIAAPNGTVVINPTGNAGISRAGSGDTLTGIVAAFLAQTFARNEPNLENAFETVVAALYLAGLAGDIAAEKFSERLMTASDVRHCLQIAIEKI